MKKVIAVSFCLICLATFAETQQPSRKDTMRQQALQASGGFVEREAKGKVAIVDMQSRVSPETIKGNIDQFTKLLRINFEYEAAKVGSFDVKGAKIPEGAQFAIFVIDDGAYPMSLVAAEVGWGMINTKQLSGNERFNVEFRRLLSMALGGGVGLFRQNQTLSVRSPFDLDAFAEDTLTIDAINSIVRNLENAGVSPKRTVSYRTACKEGWAPEPENEVQKVIWDQFHELPSKPITIEFDPAKGK